jgi:hypothetical protein
MEGDPALIALHGVKGAGKDTAFDFIVKWCAGRSQPLSAVRRGFGDKVKWAFARQFFPQISEEDAIKWANEFKNSDRIFRVPGVIVYSVDVTFRQAIAQFATESARDIYGWDFWVDQVLPLEPTDKHPEGWRGHFMVPPRTVEDDPYSFAHYAVMTDLRFPNEMERIRALGGLTVKVKRRVAEQAVIEEAECQGRDVHESELGLPDDMFDVVINNDRDLDDLYRSVVLLAHEVDYNGIASIKRGVPIPWRI